MPARRIIRKSTGILRIANKRVIFFMTLKYCSLNVYVCWGFHWQARKNSLLWGTYRWDRTVVLLVSEWINLYVVARKNIPFCHCEKEPKVTTKQSMLYTTTMLWIATLALLARNDEKKMTAITENILFFIQTVFT